MTTPTDTASTARRQVHLETLGTIPMITTASDEHRADWPNSRRQGHRAAPSSPRQSSTPSSKNGTSEVQSGRGRNPTQAPGRLERRRGCMPPWRTTRLCRNSARSWASRRSPSTGMSIRKASRMRRAGRSYWAADGRRSQLAYESYGGMNRSLGCKFGVHATVRTGRSLTVARLRQYLRKYGGPDPTKSRP